MKLREVTTRVGLCLALAFVSTFTIADAAQNDTQSKNTRSIPIAPVKIIPAPSTIGTSSIQITSTTSNTPSTIGKANYDGHLDNFPSRKATLVVPTTLRNESTAAFGKYLSDSVASVLRYPYYDTVVVSTNTPLSQITAVDLAEIAATQQSEIVIMPVPMQDIYVQLPVTYLSQYHRDDSDDIHIQAKVNAMIYYYDTNEGIVHTIRSGFNQVDDSLTMPTHKSVWNKVIKDLLDKLPYKRVPTDRDRYQSPGINAEMPVVPDYEFQVEQPKNTAYSLKGVSVL